MNKLLEIRDRLIETLISRWAQFQDSATYTNLRERFENLSPPAQKGVTWGGLAVVVLMIFMVPYSWMDSASTSVAEFEENKSLLRELLKLSQELNSAPQAPPEMSPSQIKTQVDSAIKSFGLQTEQIKDIQELGGAAEPQSEIIPKEIKQAGVQVQLVNLNLKQILDIGHRLQSLGDGIKLSGLEIHASQQDPHFYDVLFKVLNFSLPPASVDEKAGAKKPGSNK